MRGFLIGCFYGLALVLGIVYALFWFIVQYLVKPIALAAWDMTKMIWGAMKKRWRKNTQYFWYWVAKDGWPFVLMMALIGLAIAYVKLWWKQ